MVASHGSLASILSERAKSEKQSEHEKEEPRTGHDLLEAPKMIYTTGQPRDLSIKRLQPAGSAGKSRGCDQGGAEPVEMCVCVCVCVCVCAVCCVLC
jgi:hypothetical protein